MTSIKVKFRPSSITQKEGSLHYQIIHHCDGTETSYWL